MAAAPPMTNTSKAIFAKATAMAISMSALRGLG